MPTCPFKVFRICLLVLIICLFAFRSIPHLSSILGCIAGKCISLVQAGLAVGGTVGRLGGSRRGDLGVSPSPALPLMASPQASSSLPAPPQRPPEGSSFRLVTLPLPFVLSAQGDSDLLLLLMSGLLYCPLFGVPSVSLLDDQLTVLVSLSLKDPGEFLFF